MRRDSAAFDCQIMFTPQTYISRVRYYILSTIIIILLRFLLLFHRLQTECARMGTRIIKWHVFLSPTACLPALAAVYSIAAVPPKIITLRILFSTIHESPWVVFVASTHQQRQQYRQYKKESFPCPSADRLRVGPVPITPHWTTSS